MHIFRWFIILSSGLLAFIASWGIYFETTGQGNGVEPMVYVMLLIYSLTCLIYALRYKPGRGALLQRIEPQTQSW